MLRERRLNWSYELADAIKGVLPQIAAEMFKEIEFTTQQCQRMILTHAFYEVISFCRMVNITPLFDRILRKIIQLNCKAAVDFAKFMASRDKSERMLDIAMAAELFVNFDKIHEFTDLLQEALKKDLPEERDL